MAIVVDLDDQGQGIGAELVGYAESWARDQGGTRISLTSGNQRAGAHRFYKRLGYAANGVRFVKELEFDL